jgi:Nucleotide-diphospho-sugar transferase
MKPIPWYYIYSPKYEIFHHMLSSSIGPTTDFNVCPVFLPQEAFSNTYSIPGEHFFTGNTLKLDLMIKALEQHPGEHVIVSDADVIADDSSNFRLYLESYMNNDITISPDVGTTIGNLGFIFLKSTPETIKFLKDAMFETYTTQKPDLAIVNKNLATFSGRHGLFTSEVTQTNKFILGSNFYILQLLCTNHETYEKNLFEKLIAAARVLNITDLLHLIPDNVLETLRWYFQQNYPEHYMSKL